MSNFKLRSDGDRHGLEKEARRVDAEVHRLMNFVKTTDPTMAAFDTILGTLNAAVVTQKEIQAKLHALDNEGVAPRMPTVDEILEHVLDVEARIKDDPITAREALRWLLLDGKLVMHPQPDGSYLAASAVFPLALTWKPKTPRGGGPSGASSGTSSTEQVVEIGSCAGGFESPTFES